ncbi:hypothetical protein BH11ACT8_BH11ACT8_16100 [soil metagenome]
MTSKKDKASERAGRAAEAFAAAKKKERRRNLFVTVGVVLAVLAIVAVGVGINALKDNNDQKKIESSAPAAGSTDYGLVVGEDSAPHKIVVYEDFLCPICGILESTAGERLNTLIADGKVQIDYRPIAFLDTYSDEALNAFYVVRDEAGPEQAKKFHDLLFADQPEEGSSSYPGADWFIQKAVEAGATAAQVTDGIENDSQAATATAATKESSKAGVSGTPTILLDGKVFKQGSNWEEIANNLVKAVE